MTKRALAEHKRALARARAKRHYLLRKERRAVGRFTVSEELAQALVWDDEIGCRAETIADIEAAVDRLLDRYVQDFYERF